MLRTFCSAVLRGEDARYCPRRCTTCTSVPNAQSPTRGGAKSLQSHMRPSPIRSDGVSPKSRHPRNGIPGTTYAMYTHRPKQVLRQPKLARNMSCWPTNHKHLISYCGTMRITKGRPHFEESCHVQVLSKIKAN